MDCLMELTKELIAKNIKEIRKAKGISQLELANRLRFSQAYIAMLEKGKRDFDTELLNKIAEALDVSVAELLTPPEEREQVDPEKELEKTAWLIIEEALARKPHLKGKITDKDKRRLFKIILKKLKETEEDVEEFIELLAG